MELKQLQWFVTVAEELSFTKAAARLHVSQPPISRQIRLLEDELGVALFARSTQKVALTRAGEMFLEHARRTLGAAEQARNAARRAAEGGAGSLRLGYVGAAAYSFLPAVLRSFRKEHPHVELVLRVMTIQQQVQALRKAELDVGFVRMPLQDPAIETRRLVRERFVVALSVDHPLARKKQLALRELKDEGFIMFPLYEGLGLYRDVMDLCMKAGFIPQVVQEATPMQTVVGLVGAGIGVSLVPASASKLRIPEVTYLPLQEHHAFMDFAAAFRAGSSEPIVEAFLTVARKACRDAKRA